MYLAENVEEKSVSAKSQKQKPYNFVLLCLYVCVSHFT